MPNWTLLAQSAVIALFPVVVILGGYAIERAVGRHRERARAIARRLRGEAR